jgi:hypothetical protein
MRKRTTKSLTIVNDESTVVPFERSVDDCRSRGNQGSLAAAAVPGTELDELLSPIALYPDPLLAQGS